MREVIFWLSEKGNMYLWDEPEKYYICELLGSFDVNVLTKHEFHNFTLEFQAFPFAYGDQFIIPIKKGKTEIDYGGTAETPTLIILKNKTVANVAGVTVTVINRRRL